MKVQAQIKNGRLYFGEGARADIARQKLLEHEGKKVDIVIDDTPSSRKRKFFEGPIVQYWFYQNPHAGWMTFEEARIDLKREFNGVWVRDRAGNTYKTPKTTRVSNHEFEAFLERIRAYCDENGYEFPDPQDYWNWVEVSIPSPTDVYPPLKKLMDEYQEAITQ